MGGPIAALYVEMFSARVRYSGASMGYQRGGIVGGDFTPLILTAILAASNSSTGISLYIILAAVATLVATPV
jgi:MHS family shikimate/dehydroshikimate transporter-like MFS transporter